MTSLPAGGSGDAKFMRPTDVDVLRPVAHIHLVKIVPNYQWFWPVVTFCKPATCFPLTNDFESPFPNEGRGNNFYRFAET